MTTQTDEWEKEFEDSFGLDHPIRTFRDHDDYLLVRDFIRTLLTQERTRTLAKVEEWCKGKRRRSGCGCPPFQSSHDGPCWDEEFAGSAHAYNEALTDLLHHLQQLKDNTKTV